MASSHSRRVTRRRGLALEADHPFFEISESVSLLEQATEANQQQIKAVAENTSRQISDLATNTDRQLREIIAAGEQRGVEFRAEMKSLASEFAHAQKPNFILWIGIFGVIITLIGAAYKIADLQTQVTMAPIASKAEVGEKERQILRAETTTNREAIETVKAQQRVIDANLREVETQFRALDQTRAIQFAEQERINNLLMQIGQDVRPLKYPEGPYFFPGITDGQGGKREQQ